jgi:putative membrane protein
MEEPLVKTQSQKEPLNKLIIAVSVIIPVVVAVLFGVKIDGYDLTFLPPIYATINGITAVVLICAFLAIKNGKRQLHENLMKTCIVLSALFLIMYVAYHMTSESTPYGGAGVSRNIYFFILISHILLSVGVIPLVLFTYLRAWRGEFARHRKLAKIAFPVWLYVAVTGVIVYLMISPYYK